MLIRKVYDAQKIAPGPSDFYTDIQNDIRKYDIQISDQDIMKMSKRQYRNLVHKNVDNYAHKYLLGKAKSQSKCIKIVEDIRPKSIKIQDYLVCDQLTKEEVQLLFTLRVRSFPVKANMKSQFLGDPLWGVTSRTRSVCLCVCLCLDI